MDQERISTWPFLCDDILWVLTAPAAWTDSAKQLMRESANNLGFSNTYLHHNATKFQTQEIPVIQCLHFFFIFHICFTSNYFFIAISFQ